MLDGSHSVVLVVFRARRFSFGQFLKYAPFFNVIWGSRRESWIHCLEEFTSQSSRVELWVKYLSCSCPGHCRRTFFFGVGSELGTTPYRCPKACARARERLRSWPHLGRAILSTTSPPNDSVVTFLCQFKVWSMRHRAMLS